MIALLQKDRPWLLFFLIGGSLGLAGSLLEHSFFYTFLVTWGHHEALFHVAWSIGLGLGVTAACFDEALGTREYLAQRPVAVGTVARSRLLGCLLVLAAWFVLAPTLAYAWFAVFDHQFQADGLDQVPFQWVTMVVAVSACGIGFAAGSLPFVWWARLLWAAVLLVPSYTLVHWLSTDDGYSELATFTALHLLLGAGSFALGFAAMRHRRDVDVPLPQPVRIAVLAPCLLAGTLGFCIVQMELEAAAVHRLHRTYPFPVVVDGRVELGVRGHWDEPVRLVDGEHRDTGRTESWRIRGSIARGGNDIPAEFLRLEPPRQREARSLAGNGRGFLLIDADGDVFVRDGQGSFRRAGKGPSHSAFAAESNGGVLLATPDSLTLVGDRADGTLWRHDPALGYFVPFELPDGDRFQRVDTFDAREHVLLPGQAPPAKGETTFVVAGERFVYAWRAGRLVPMATHLPRKAKPPAVERTRVIGDDVLAWTLEIDGWDDVPAFRHDYQPRTLLEWFYAGSAIAQSMVRPPLLQIAAASSPPVSSRWTWLADPLVACGRRWWLVLLTCALAGLAAWSTRRRLLRLGASQSTVTFWFVAALGFGLFGAWAAIVCERPRAYARRPVVSTSPPRLVSRQDATESVA